MTTTSPTTEYTLDAAGKKLGRLASEAAMILRGKNTPAFTPNKVSGHTVRIINAAQIDLADIKIETEYTRHTGYPGGLIKEKRGAMMKRKGYAVIFEKAVYGMLPNNKLRKQLMKNLIVTE